MAKHAAGGPPAQQRHIVDAVPAGEQGVDQGEPLGPRVGRARPGSPIDHLVGGLLDPSRSARVAGTSSPAPATGCSSSKAIPTWSSTRCEDGLEKVSSGSGIMTAWQPSFSLVRGPFSQSAHHHRITDSVDRGSERQVFARLS